MPRNKKLEFTIDEPWELVVAAYDLPARDPPFLTHTPLA
jgi:hypothetical protein